MGTFTLFVQIHSLLYRRRNESWHGSVSIFSLFRCTNRIPSIRGTQVCRVAGFDGVYTVLDEAVSQLQIYRYWMTWRLFGTFSPYPAWLWVVFLPSCASGVVAVVNTFAHAILSPTRVHFEASNVQTTISIALQSRSTHVQRWLPISY